MFDILLTIWLTSSFFNFIWIIYEISNQKSTKIGSLENKLMELFAAILCIALGPLVLILVLFFLAKEKLGGIKKLEETKEITLVAQTNIIDKHQAAYAESLKKIERSVYNTEKNSYANSNEIAKLFPLLLDTRENKRHLESEVEFLIALWKSQFHNPSYDHEYFFKLYDEILSNISKPQIDIDSLIEPEYNIDNILAPDQEVNFNRIYQGIFLPSLQQLESDLIEYQETKKNERAFYNLPANKSNINYDTPTAYRNPIGYPYLRRESNGPWQFISTTTFNKQLKKLDGNNLKSVKVALSEIQKSPLNKIGKRLYPLRGNQKGLWRYRIGDYRLLYQPNKKNMIVMLLSFDHRSKVYK